MTMSISLVEIKDALFTRRGWENNWTWIHNKLVDIFFYCGILIAAKFLLAIFYPFDLVRARRTSRVA